jgi:hypothetical protein
MEKNAKKEQKIPLAVMSELVARMSLANKLGTQQYGGDRDIYRALGYPETLLFSDYYGRYKRQDIAKAVIDRPIAVTWRGDVTIVESDDADETLLEKEWKALDKRLQLKSKFVRVDRLTGLGTYGILLLGLDDVIFNEDFTKPVTTGKRKLFYVKPLSSSSATIQTFETDPKSERYGFPLIYQVTVQNLTLGNTLNLQVHHTRIIHIVDDLLENEVEGAPRLQSVFNRLMDLEKLVGGDAEMFWRGARPGYHGKIDKDYQMDDKALLALQDQFDEYEHNLRRMLVNEGVDFQSLAQQIADPAGHVDIQMQMISAVTGIPKRILTGSERGELSSAQDKSEWLEYVTGRREEYAEQRIIRPFVDRCIEYQILPKPKEDYSIEWNDLFSVSDKDKAEIGRIRATALKEYLSSPTAEDAVPMEAFLSLFMGLTDEQTEWINELREEQIKEDALNEEDEPEIPEIPEETEIPPIPPVETELEPE